MPKVSLPQIATASTIELVLRWTARGILIAIAAFWLWFGIADGLYDAQSSGIMGFLMMLPAAILTLAVLYIAWRWELVGGYVLLAVTALGLLAFIENIKRGGQTPLAVIGLLAVFVLPFLIPAVALLLKCALQHRRAAH